MSSAAAHPARSCDVKLIELHTKVSYKVRGASVTAQRTL